MGILYKTMTHGVILMLYEFVLTFIFTLLVVTTINFIVNKILPSRSTKERNVDFLMGQSLFIATLLTWVI
jgi:hypothetical protein